MSLIPELPVVVQTAYEFNVWLIEKVQRFPRNHRFGVGGRLLHGVLDLLLRLGRRGLLPRPREDSGGGEWPDQSTALSAAAGEGSETAGHRFLRVRRGASRGNRTHGRRLAESQHRGLNHAARGRIVEHRHLVRESARSGAPGGFRETQAPRRRGISPESGSWNHHGCDSDQQYFPERVSQDPSSASQHSVR